MKKLWGKAHLPLANVQVRRFTYDVEDAEEEHTAYPRGDVQLVVTAKQRLPKNIHGESRIFIGKEFARILDYLFL